MSDGELTVIVDVPRGSFVKRGDDGAFDFASPFPCPFNYGHVPETRSEDGDGEDAVVIGPRLPRGSAATVTVRGRIGFLDAGCPDPKWICADAPLSSLQRAEVEAFFRFYAFVKGLINRVRGKVGATRYLGWL